MIDNFFAWLLSLSRGEMLGLILGVVILCVVVYFSKKMVKIAVVGICLLACLLYFGLVTPEQLKSSAEALADTVTSQEVVSLSVVSEKVQITDGVIEFKINDTWYCLDDVTRLRVNADGVYLIEVEDSEIQINDADVQKLIDVLLESNDNDE